MWRVGLDKREMSTAPSCGLFITVPVYKTQGTWVVLGCWVLGTSSSISVSAKVVVSGLGLARSKGASVGDDNVRQPIHTSEWGDV